MAANVPSSSDRRPGSADEGANDLPASESPQHEEEVNREDMKEGKQKEEEEREEKGGKEDREEDRAELKENNVPTDAEKEEKEQEREQQQQQEEEEEEKEASAPPLPDEEVPPPLPNEAPPGQTQDDGWEPVWDANALAYYFYNRFTGISQWENPRMPGATSTSASTSTAPPPPLPPGINTSEETSRAPAAGGYNPAIHGDYDPTAPYAQQYEQQHNPEAFEAGFPGIDPNSSYVVAGSFNRFTGRWQPSTLAPENYNEENKSHRQMRAFFDVDAAANSHNGRSLKAERSGKKLSKKELKAFRDKRRDKKEEKRRAWLRD